MTVDREVDLRGKFVDRFIVIVVVVVAAAAAPVAAAAAAAATATAVAAIRSKKWALLLTSTILVQQISWNWVLGKVGVVRGLIHLLFLYICVYVCNIVQKFY